jgi:acetyltransferase-like isoleucine patch superfamily enzyme
MRIIIRYICFILLHLKYSNCIRCSKNIKYIKIQKCNIEENNVVDLKSGVFYGISISIKGKDNHICMNSNYISNLSVTIVGVNNILNIEHGVKLYNTKIVIRGNNCNITIKEETTIGGGTIICMGIDNYINIGSFCMFADEVDIWATDSHPIINSNGDVINTSLPIVIEDHVWLGKGVRILKGVKIFHDAIVGMGSLVTKDIPEKTLNVGVPSKTIKSNVSWSREFIKI